MNEDFLKPHERFLVDNQRHGIIASATATPELIQLLDAGLVKSAYFKDGKYHFKLTGPGWDVIKTASKYILGSKPAASPTASVEGN